MRILIMIMQIHGNDMLNDEIKKVKIYNWVGPKQCT